MENENITENKEESVVNENLTTEIPNEKPKAEKVKPKKATFLPMYKSKEYYFGRYNSGQSFTILDKSFKSVHEKRGMQLVETLEDALSLSTEEMKSKTQKAYDNFVNTALYKKCSTC